MEEYTNKSKLSLAPPAFRVWLCGTYRVERYGNRGYEAVRTADWGGSSYPRLLMKALLCSPLRQARREALLEMLWPEVDPEQAVQHLNTATSKLRKVMLPSKEQESFLVTEDDGRFYRLEGQETLWVDADAALALLREVEQIERLSPRALALLEEAAKYLGRGAFLEDEDGLWLYGRRSDLKEMYYNVRRWLAEAYVEQGMIGQAEIQWKILLLEDPSDEDVLRLAMIQLYRHGMGHKADRLYQQIVTLSAKDNLPLTRETEAFAQQMRNEPSIALQDQFSSMPMVQRASSLLSLEPEVQGLLSPTEHATILPVHMETVALGQADPSAWFGGKLANLLTLVEECCGHPTFCLELQQKIGKELNGMQPKTDDEGYTLSRRQLLITLATLPTALLLTMLQGRHSAGQIEQLLTRCAASIAACWHLMRGSEYAVIEEILPTYLPLLSNLAQNHRSTRALLQV